MSGVGVLFGAVLEEGESETESNADKIAESRGFRGAVIKAEGGGRETEIGDGIAGTEALCTGGVSLLRCDSGGRDFLSP